MLRRTLSKAKVRTVYSANVSSFSSVILMSPYISLSSGQYLQHFTCLGRDKQHRRQQSDIPRVAEGTNKQNNKQQRPTKSEFTVQHCDLNSVN